MRLQFYNKGNPEQISGGYLYNKYLIEELRRSGVQVSYLSDFSADTLQKSRVDIVIVDSLMIYDLAKSLMATQVPVLLLIHLPPDVFLDLEQKSNPNKEILERLYAKCHIVVTGGRSRDHLLERYTELEERLSLIEPGLPVNWRQKWTYAETPKRLVCIANFVQGKGHLKLLEVLAQLVDIDWQLGFYGSADLDEAYFQHVMSRVTVLGLQTRVYYRGCVAHEAINEVLIQSDLLLQFSDFETYSMVIAEAINTKLPVVSTRCGAYENFEQSGLVYYLHETEAAAVANEIRPILTNANDYGKLLKVKLVKTNTWEVVGQQFFRLLKTLKSDI